MTYRELAISQQQRALDISRYMSEMPVNVMNRLKLHKRIAELHISSMQLRSIRPDLLDVEVPPFKNETYYSKLNPKKNEFKVPTTKPKSYQFARKSSNININN